MQDYLSKKKITVYLQGPSVERVKKRIEQIMELESTYCMLIQVQIGTNTAYNEGSCEISTSTEEDEFSKRRLER